MRQPERQAMNGTGRRICRSGVVNYIEHSRVQYDRQRVHAGAMTGHTQACWRSDEKLFTVSRIKKKKKKDEEIYRHIPQVGRRICNTGPA
jgi:hypothetical protein